MSILKGKQPRLQTVSFTSNVQPGFDDPSLVTWDDAQEGTLSVARVEEVHRADKVYNIEVEGNHTYFVTEEGVLVHNYEGEDNGPGVFEQIKAGVATVWDSFFGEDKVNSKLFDENTPPPDQYSLGIGGNQACAFTSQAMILAHLKGEDLDLQGLFEKAKAEGAVSSTGGINNVDLLAKIAGLEGYQYNRANMNKSSEGQITNLLKNETPVLLRFSGPNSSNHFEVAYGTETINGTKYLKVKDPGVYGDTHVSTKDWRTYVRAKDGTMVYSGPKERVMEGYGYWTPKPKK